MDTAQLYYWGITCSQLATNVIFFKNYLFDQNVFDKIKNWWDKNIMYETEYSIQITLKVQT